MSHFLGYHASGRIRGRAPANAPSLSMHAIATRRAPDKLLRPGVEFVLGLGDNDKVGSCGPTGFFNVIRAQANISGFQEVIQDGAELAFYERFGFIPGKADPGTNLSALLASQSQKAVDGGGQTPFTALFGTHDPKDLNLTRNIMAEFGAAYLGILVSPQDTFDGVMDVGPADQDADEGHCLLALTYTGTAPTDIVTLGTWGSPAPDAPLYQATWRWLQARTEESHLLAFPQLIGAGGWMAKGIDRDRLAADCAAFSS
jgi:hypothetical protein